MTEHRDEDLSGARFEHVSLRGATFDRVDLREAQFRGALLRGTRMRGVELVDVEISGELRNVVVNGVDIAPLVDAELDRRMPERATMRPDDADGFREAWRTLERLWEGTVARARALPEAALHERVDGEWSFIQTLRHLGFASAAWVGRMVLGNASPWHPLDLPWDEAPGWDGIPWDREARPSLDEVLAVRRERQAMVGQVMASLTDEQLASRVTCTEPGWPQLEGFPLGRCLRIVLNEEWEHRLYAERDLQVLASSPAGMVDPRQTVVGRWLAAGDAGDLDAFDDLLHPEVVVHAPGGLSTASASAEKAVWHDALEAMPDLRHDVQEVVVDGDVEMARVVVTGTMARAFGGVAGTGRGFRIDQAVITHLRDGKVIEAWEIADIGSLSEQVAGD